MINFFTSKNIWRLYPLVILAAVIAYFHFTGENNQKKLYQKEIHSIVVKRTGWGATKTMYFYLDNGLIIDSNYLYKIDLRVGDSISKKANTRQYNIYRKENGKYRLYRENILMDD